MKKLARSLVAVAMAAISVPTAPPQPAGAGAAAERTINAPRAQETTKAAPVRVANSNSLSYAMVGGGNCLITRPPCIFPQNRPQPGWRKVQSRRRHNERMRRQRRNA